MLLCKLYTWFCQNVSLFQKNTHWKRYAHPYVHCSMTSTGQDMGAARVSLSRWVDKEQCTYLQWNTSRPWRNEISPSAITQRDLHGVMLSEISQTEKDSYHTIFHSHVESKNQSRWTNKPKQKQTHRYRGWAAGWQTGGAWETGTAGEGAKQYKLTVREWVTGP